MAEKSKKVKKVTKIEDASVTIEVDEKEDKTKAAEEEKEEESVEESEPDENDQDESGEDEKENNFPEKDTVEPRVENFDEDSSSSISWKKVFLYTVIAAGIGFLILAGFFFIMKNFDLSFSKDSTKSIELPSTAPTPTAEEVDKEAYEIQVLNGSGIAGEAAAVQTLLEDEGFSVSEIGNAETSDFTDTQILVGEDVDEAFIEELTKALEERGPVEVDEAPSSQTEDVVVIVGSETTEAEATPTPELE